MLKKIIAALSLISIALVACSNATSDVLIPQTSPVQEVRETAISSGDLSGLYLNAGHNGPVILIVPGSGPTDLDGNNSLGIETNSYKLMAEALAAEGISTVRVDKRGLFSSEAAGDPNAVTVDIYAHSIENDP
jgi:hypothetical protein